VLDSLTILMRCLSAVLTLAIAQGILRAQTPLTCVVTAVPPLVRAEGVAELVGDLVVKCTGGTPTSPGATVPQVNLQIFLNTPITSRLLNDPFSEALLFVDDAPPPVQRVCTSGPCSVQGIGGTGIAYTQPSPSNIPNIFQGRQVGTNALLWAGIPIDPPGTNQTRTIRITNVRANASQLGASATLIPAQISMFVSATPSNFLVLANPQQTVGFVQTGLDVSVRDVDVNQNVLGAFGSSGVSLQDCAFTSRQVILRYQERFAKAFKIRALTNGPVDGSSTPPDPLPQPIPGVNSSTETGFFNPALPPANAVNQAGLATQGTRLIARFTNIPDGVSVFAGLGDLTGTRAKLVATDANGGGPFSVATDSPPAQNGVVTAVWEVISADPFAIDTIDFLVTITYGPTSGSGTGSVTAGFAPVTTITVASSSAPVPRFLEGSARALFNTSVCRVSILFPFVTNQAGFDSGIAISNTSLDPFGTFPQQGACTLNYYGTTAGGGAAPGPQKSQPIPPGEQLAFTLSGGGSRGIGATPGFQGYIIATCGFPYAHGFVFVGDLGAQSLAQGYLGVVLDGQLLDADGLTRTKVRSEVLKH
jgi:hypothetical protein